MTVKPRWPAGLRTISTVMRSRRCAQAGEAAVGEQVSGAAGLADLVEVQAEQGAPPTLAVVDVGGADQDRQQQAERVGDDEPLPTAGLLAGVLLVGVLHALGVDHPGGRV